MINKDLEDLEGTKYTKKCKMCQFLANSINGDWCYMCQEEPIKACKHFVLDPSIAEIRQIMGLTAKFPHLGNT